MGRRDSAASPSFLATTISPLRPPDREIRIYRPTLPALSFALSCTLGKIVRRGLAERLCNLGAPHGPSSYLGTMKGLGTIDALDVLRRVVDEFLWSKEDTLIISRLYFYKAYAKSQLNYLKLHQTYAKS